MVESGSEALERASELFAQALARRESGESVDLGALPAAHPELASVLERLHANWRRLEEGFPRLESSSASTDAEVPARERELLLRLAARRAAPRRYELGAEVGRGGMGAVLQVRDEDLARTSAMKVADLDSAPDARARRARLARFLREARVTGQLEHPGIVPVHELGVDAAGRPYFTMPLVRGSDLRIVFEQAQRGVEGWTLTRAVGVLLKVCETVAFAHSRGVVHRDLKPANVMVGSYGEVRVLDWGLAKLVGVEERVGLATEEDTECAAPDATLPWATREGSVLGTPAYMPPEQAAGRGRAIDERADVYAIGAMLYHLLAGSAPYADRASSTTAQAAIEEVLAGPPTPLDLLAPSAPPELGAVCERAMRREPAERYASVQALAEDLRAWLEGRVVSAYERGALAELRKWVGRNRAVAALLGALAVALPLAASLATYAAATRDDVLAATGNARRERVETLLEEAFLELGDGDTTHALARFRTALEEDPSSVEARAGQALALRHLGRAEEALSALEGLEADAETEAALALLFADFAPALDVSGQPVSNDTLRMEPRSPLGAFLVAERELNRGHAGAEDAFARAAELLERAVSRSHRARRLYVYELAHAVLHAGPSDRRREMAATLLALWPEEAGALYAAGHALAAADELEEALPLLRRALALKPESAPIRFGLAWALRRAGERNAAGEILRAILDSNSGATNAREELALLLLDNGELAEAVEQARELARLRPQRASSREVLGLALIEAGASAEGLQELRVAVRLSGGSRAKRCNLISHLATAGVIEEALALARQLVREDPSDAAAHAWLGRALHAAGDEDGARAAWTEALRLDPREPVANRYEGRARLDAGDLDAAQTHLEASLAVDPRPGRVHYNLGLVHWKQRSFEEAAAAFRSALRWDPVLAEAHCNLGHALRMLGRFEEALESLRRGHELGSARADWEYPSASWIEELEALIERDRRLQQVLADPGSAGVVERAELASFALDSGRAAVAVALFEDALAERDALPADSQHRLFACAARAAARAALEPSADAARSAELRALALRWLEEDQLELEQWLVAGRLREDFVHAELAALEAEPDLASVREPGSLAELDGGEAGRWRARWDAIAALKASCAGVLGR